MKLGMMLLFSLSMALCYYTLIMSAIGLAAAGKVFWWANGQQDPLFYHIAQNMVGIGTAALVPAVLIHYYQSQQKWLSALLMLLGAMLYLGNINAVLFDPMGLVRFVEQTWRGGDIGAIAIFFDVALWPLLWLLVLQRFSSKTQPSWR